MYHVSCILYWHGHWHDSLNEVIETLTRSTGTNIRARDLLTALAAFSPERDHVPSVRAWNACLELCALPGSVVCACRRGNNQSSGCKPLLNSPSYAETNKHIRCDIKASESHRHAYPPRAFETDSSEGLINNESTNSSTLRLGVAAGTSTAALPPG